jgi:hypothetical protein
MTRFTALLFCFIQLLFLPLAKAEDRCLALLEPVKNASQRYLAEDFPYWYNLAPAKKPNYNSGPQPTGTAQLAIFN